MVLVVFIGRETGECEKGRAWESRQLFLEKGVGYYVLFLILIRESMFPVFVVGFFQVFDNSIGFLGKFLNFIIINI